MRMSPTSSRSLSIQRAILGSDSVVQREAPGLRVALVSMPFGALERPSLGLGLLQAGARRRGHDCSVHYLGFAFAASVGLDDYTWVCNEVPYTAFAGEWLFAEALNGPDAGSDRGYLDDTLRRTWQLDEASIDRILRMRAWVEPFLEQCSAAVNWTEVDVVGFTSTFQQNVASLALARRLSVAFPHLTIVFGGANWEGPMGLELHRLHPYVDVACSGEADETFPALLTALPLGALAAVPGLVFRDVDGASICTGPARPIEDLDTLPVPDFSDFLAALAACPVASDLLPMPLIETSRGCWWGAHSHCTFCGLNGGSLAYRSKSPDRCFDELRTIVEQFGHGRVGFVDNILDMRYFRTFLPRVAAELPGLSMFYEVKSSLTNRQVETLVKAGVHEIQPGIESLSDHVLGLMRKGTSMLRNVQLLKWCAEHGLRADWNVLYGVPGETSDDYNNMLAVIDVISHLEPPTACGPVRLDRFSPYHNDPASFGITSVTPMDPYRHLYPGAGESLDRIAYYFDFVAPSLAGVDERSGPLRASIERWKASLRGSLTQIVSDEGDMVLIDDRGGGVHRYDLAGWQASVYLTCDAITSASDLTKLPLMSGVSARDLADFINWCVGRKLMLVQQRDCLSLAVRVPARSYSPASQPRLGRRLALLGVGGA
jgi:ribosomal peptide maturation radical SAM protein 1